MAQYLPLPDHLKWYSAGSDRQLLTVENIFPGYNYKDVGVCGINSVTPLDETCVIGEVKKETKVKDNKAFERQSEAELLLATHKCAGQLLHFRSDVVGKWRLMWVCGDKIYKTQMNSATFIKVWIHAIFNNSQRVVDGLMELTWDRVPS